MSVNKKVLEKLSDFELEGYTKTDSKFVLQAQIYAFEILQKRNKIFSPEEQKRLKNLLNEATIHGSKNTATPLKIIWSPFIIIIGLLEVFLFFFSLYYLFIENNGGGALGGTIALIGFIIFFFVLVVEQLILRNIKTERNTIWTIEIILLIITFLYFYVFGFSIG